MTTANDRIILVRVKIERAKTHLCNLERDLSEFGSHKFYAVTTEPDTHFQELGEHRILKFDFLAAAGDVVHNLRSALDHLAYQLVWVGSGEEPSRRVEFPIAKDAATYEREKTGKVEGMCPKVIKAIDALKPYRGGNDALWRIHELDNIDKHRQLFTYSRDCMLVADWLAEYGSVGPTGFAGPFNLKASNPQFSAIDALDCDVEKDMQFEIDQAISKAQVLTGDAILPSLHQLTNFTWDLILSFKPFLE
jgi:hypothetical protein